MRLALLGIDSIEIPNLENWQPSDRSFGFPLDIYVSRSDGLGEEIYSVTVCTPDWFIANRMSSSEVISGWGILFVSEFNYGSLYAFIERAVHRAEAKNWRDLTKELSWLGGSSFNSWLDRALFP